MDELWQKVPERFKVVIDKILSKNDVGHVEYLANEILSKKYITPDDLSHFFLSLMVSTVDAEKKHKWIDEIVEVGSNTVLSRVGSQCSWLLEGKPQYIVPLLVKLFRKVDYSAFHNLSHALNKLMRDGVPPDISLHELRRVITERITRNPSSIIMMKTCWNSHLLTTLTAFWVL